MADADVRAEARQLLDVLNTDSSRVNPATGTSESFNKDTADNTKTLTEQVDEILGNLPKKKTAKEKRDDVVEEATIQAEATAKTLVSSLNPAVGALSKIANSILGVTRSVLGAGLKAGGLALGFRGAMAAFDEFMQPDQSMKERLINAITGFLARSTTDILNFVGVDVNYEEMKKKIREFFDRTVKFLETLPADVEEKFEKFKVDFKETFEYIRDEALPTIYSIAQEIVRLGGIVYDFVTTSGDELREREKKTRLESTVDAVGDVGGGFVMALETLSDSFAAARLRLSNAFSGILATFYRLSGQGDKADAIRAEMLDLQNIAEANKLRREQRIERRRIRKEQEQEQRILDVRLEALERIDSMFTDKARERFLKEFGMSEEDLRNSVKTLQASIDLKLAEIVKLDASLSRTMGQTAQGFTVGAFGGDDELTRHFGASVSVMDMEGNKRVISVPLSKVDPESIGTDEFGNPTFSLLDQFGDVNAKRIGEIVPLVTQVLQNNPDLLAGSDERLATAIKQAIEDANLSSNVIIDAHSEDNSTNTGGTQPTPGDQGSDFHGPLNEPAVVVGG